MSDLPSHGVPDDVDPTGWELAVDGRVGQPRTYAREDLRAMPLAERTGDFSCVEGWTASGLTWRGVELDPLLDDADEDASFALVHAMDGEYACGFPLAALDGALLAIELDGEPLPVEHGGPARLVPAGDGADCWESVKWVSRLELLAEAPTAVADTARDLALSRVE